MTMPQLGREREDRQAEGRGGSRLRRQRDWLLWGLATLAWQWLSVKLTICLCLRSVSSAISAVRCCRLSCTVSRGRASPRAFSTVFFFFAHPPTRVFVFSGALGSSGGGLQRGERERGAGLCNEYWREPGDASRAGATGAVFAVLNPPSFPQWVWPEGALAGSYYARPATGEPPPAARPMRSSPGSSSLPGSAIKSAIDGVSGLA